MPRNHTDHKFVYLFLLTVLLLSACSCSEKSIAPEQAIVEYDLPEKPLSFNDEVLSVRAGIFDLNRYQNR